MTMKARGKVNFLSGRLTPTTVIKILQPNDSEMIGEKGYQPDDRAIKAYRRTYEN